MVQRAEAQGFIPGEKFGNIKDRRAVEVGPCRKQLWYMMHQIRIPSGIASTDAAK